MGEFKAKAIANQKKTKASHIFQKNIVIIGVDRLSAWPIISADIKHFYDYRSFSKPMCR